MRRASGSLAVQACRGIFAARDSKRQRVHRKLDECGDYSPLRQPARQPPLVRFEGTVPNDNRTECLFDRSAGWFGNIQEGDRVDE